MVAFLFWRIGELKDEQSTKLQEIYRLEWKLVTIEAEKDSIRGLGEYSVVDTIWLKKQPKIIYRDSLQVDTVYEDILQISGQISFDTTQVFGEDSSLSIQVKGKFYYPDEFKWRNWIQVIPDWRKTPVMPATRQTSRKWGVGLGLLASSNGAYSVGGTGRFNRTSLSIYRQINKNDWTIGLNYAIIK